MIIINWFLIVNIITSQCFFIEKTVEAVEDTKSNESTSKVVLMSSVTVEGTAINLIKMVINRFLKIGLVVFQILIFYYQYTEDTARPNLKYKYFRIYYFNFYIYIYFLQV